MSDQLTPPERLKTLRHRAGMSLEEISKLLGYKGPSSYQRYEDEGRFNQDYLPFPLIKKLLNVLQGLGEPPIGVQEILSLGGLSAYDDGILPNNTLASTWLIGIAEANAWRIEPEQSSRVRIPSVIPPNFFPRLERLALRVRGDAFNKHYPDGSIVHFLPFSNEFSSEFSLLGGHIVVRQRRMELSEITIREYHEDEAGRATLFCRSYTEVHPPLLLDLDRTYGSLTIIGRVFASVRFDAALHTPFQT